MPKSIKKKIAKKSAAEIEVKGIALKMKEFFLRKKNVSVTIAGAVIITIAAVAGFFIYGNITKNKAEKLAYEAYRTYYGIYQKAPVAKEERFGKALELFKSAFDEKKSAIYLFYIADCYYSLNKYDDAESALKKLIKDFPDDDELIPLSYNKLAMISLKKGINDDALKFLSGLYDYKAGIFKDLSLLESGQILEVMGRSDEAKKKYEELTKKFPESPFIKDIQPKGADSKG